MARFRAPMLACAGHLAFVHESYSQDISQCRQPCSNTRCLPSARPPATARRSAATISSAAIRTTMVRLNFKGRVVYSGEADIGPGITLHPTYGHSHGLQSVRVHTKRGWLVIASDATHFYANLRTDRPFTTAFHLGEMLDAFRTLERLAPTPRHIVPGHDPYVMMEYPAPKGSLAGIAVRLDAEPIAPALVRAPQRDSMRAMRAMAAMA